MDGRECQVNYYQSSAVRGGEQRSGTRRTSDCDIVGAWAAATTALDQLSHGVALVGLSGRVRFINQTARTICAEFDGLRLLADRLIGTVEPGAELLERALKRVVLGGSGGSGGSEDLRLTRPSGRRALSIAVRAVPSHDAAATPLGAMVWISDPERIEVPPRERLMRCFGLTAAEAAVLRWFLRGCKPLGIARRLGISIETARTHLRSVLAKTGTHCQSELMRRALHELGGII
jgi:DNA-binding CsgD family transcriptional regulator